MYDFIETILSESISDPAVSFVFPSEAAAATWSRRALEISGARALSVDRFMGWDTFKERLFSRHRDALPAERRARLLWAASALDANARDPFLTALIREEHRRESLAYVPYIAGILPNLRRIAEGAGRLPGDDKVRDFSALHARYRSFLSDSGLFEPSYETLPATKAGGLHILFCPELARDFGDYRAVLAASDAVRIVDLPSETALPALLRFPNLHEELAWIFRTVARDLDSGLRPEQLAVTVPDLEDTAPWVEKAAALAGVPAEIRSGFPLARHPVGRFLAALGACSERSFDLESVTALLLDRFLPWKEPASARDLVRFGIKRHAYAPFRSGGRTFDPWLESFRVCGVPEAGLDSYYRRLKAGVERVTGAADFRALAAAFVGFRKEFLDESRLTEEDQRSFQRAMDELKGFARKETELGLPAPAGSAFSLFRNALSEIRYVHQSAGPAVPVYDYRVSALLAVRKHFVAGCSQEGLRVSFGDAPGLREDQKEALGLPDRDVSAAYLGAYAASGCTVFSYAEEGFRGWNLPYPAFSRGAAAKPPEDYESLRSTDPWTGEAAAWCGGAFPEEVRAEQRAAVRFAARSLRPPESDYERDLAAPEAIRIILSRFSETDGRLRLSATQVEELRSCPFAWLLSRGLALREELSGIGFFDALLAGEMAHEVLRALYKRISDSGPFGSEEPSVYESWIEPAIARTLPDFERRYGPFLRPMFDAYVPKLTDRIRRLLAEEAVSFRGWEIEKLEDEMQKDYPDLQAVLTGRLDRLVRLEEDYAIIDYKKRRLPRLDEVYADDDDNLQAPQMAAYVLLCEHQGKPIRRARYWSLEDARALDVLGPGALDRGDYGESLAVFDRYLGETADTLRRGDFRPPRPEERNCGTCGWQAACRVRYATG